VEELATAEVVVVGLDVGGRRGFDRPSFFLAEHDPQRPHDVLGDLVLDREDVLQLPVVAL